MTISILIPVFNEVSTITTTLDRLDKVKMPGIQKEVIVIDDGSSDGTREVLEKYNQSKVVKIFQNKNQGKGAAIKEGIGHAHGEYILIQDADLEYNPSQIPDLILPIIEKKANVVYGTRLNRLPNFSKDEKNPLFLLHYLGNRFLSLVTSALYGQWITDMETGYKVFPRSALKGITIYAKGFDFEPEITVKLIKLGYKIYEVPIQTNPRGYEKGKKLHARKEGIKALVTLIGNKF